MKKMMMTTILAAATVMVLGACSTTKELFGSDTVPSAQGEVVTKKEEFGNTKLTLNVKHLAPAQRIQEGANNYVVWIKPLGTETYQNIGALNVDKDLEGSYTTSVPHQSFQIMVTPEAAVAATEPTGPAVFEDTVSE